MLETCIYPPASQSFYLWIIVNLWSLVTAGPKQPTPQPALHNLIKEADHDWFLNLEIALRFSNAGDDYVHKCNTPITSMHHTLVYTGWERIPIPSSAGSWLVSCCTLDCVFNHRVGTNPTILRRLLAYQLLHIGLRQIYIKKINDWWRTLFIMFGINQSWWLWVYY